MGAARAAFRKHVTTEERFNEVMAATKAQTREMLGRDADKRPHGATWLNQERWKDEKAARKLTMGEKAVLDYLEMGDLV